MVRLKIKTGNGMWLVDNVLWINIMEENILSDVYDIWKL